MSTPEDRAEQQTPVVRASDDDVQVPLEAVDADVVEQSEDAGPTGPRSTTDLPLEVDPADAAEQSDVVELDDDERR